MKRVRNYAIWWMLFALFEPQIGLAKHVTHSVSTKNEAVFARVEHIQNRLNESRGDDAYKLSVDVKRENKNHIHTADIDKIAELLSDENDEVRYWSAVSLGYIGRPAKSAEPQLQKALSDRICHWNSSQRTRKTSLEAIEGAMARIGINPRPQCPASD